MSKTKPRWYESGLFEVPEFALDTDQAGELATMLSATDPEKIDQLREELNEIGHYYLSSMRQDEIEPSRAERNAALEQILDASEGLERKLNALDSGTESRLMDIIPSYRSIVRDLDEDGNVKETPGNAESGFAQIEALRRRLSHFNAHARPYHNRQRRLRGPQKNLVLHATVDALADLYRRETSKSVTHTPYQKTEYMSAPQSDAGHFIATFLKIVGPKLPPSTISSTIAAMIRHRNTPD